MLTHPTTDRLRELGLAGMARALEEQRRDADAADHGLGVGSLRDPTPVEKVSTAEVT